MNLHGIVAGAIGAVNPLVLGSLQASAGGYSTAPDGTRTPAYATAQAVPMQVQALTTRDLQHLDSLNVQGSTHSIYLNGSVEGLVRGQNRGGDLITLPSGQVFLVTEVLENWPDWTKVAATLQVVPSAVSGTPDSTVVVTDIGQPSAAS